MNDYLSQLAARNLPQAAPSLGADVILPRPFSLFETAVSPTDTIQLEEETVAAPPPALPSPPPPSTVRTHQPATEVERGSGQRPQPFVNDQEPAAPDTPPLPPWLQQLRTLTQQPPAVSRPAVPTSHEGDDEPYSGPLMPEGDPPETATAVTPPPSPSGQKESKTPIDPAPQQQIVERQVVETRRVERIGRKPVVSETIVERDTPSPTVVSPLPPPPAKRVTPPQHDERKVVVTETRPYAPPSHPPPATERPLEQTPAPTVHVTIGRVEVRATRPTAVPPRRPRQTPSPVMSLDDYLRQRANGESR